MTGTSKDAGHSRASGLRLLDLIGDQMFRPNSLACSFDSEAIKHEEK